MRFATKRVHFTLLLVLLLFALPAQAVRLAQGEAGQVAILPLYNTLGGMDTLIKISNRPEYSAVRLQFRGAAGEPTESLNIYLGPDEAWQAALSTGVDGPRLTTTDASCTLVPGEILSAQPLQSELALSQPYGYAEVLLMGHFEADFEPGSISQLSCEGLAAEFSDGPWSINGNTGVLAPTNSLHVHYQLINVERGTRYGLDAVHLAQFRDQPFHVPPSEPFGLADAHDDGTATGQTRSLVCDAGCTIETWADPRDAVASVLLAVARRVDYVVNPDIGASSSVVVLNPMDPYYVDGEISEPEAGLYTTDSDAGLVSPFICPPLNPANTLCPPAYRLIQPEALSAFSVNLDDSQMPLIRPLPILEIPGIYPIDDSLTNLGGELISGSTYVLFPSFGVPSVTSKGGTAYFGLPSIVVGFTELVNGELDSSSGEAVIANYGSAAFGVKANSVIGAGH